jgi:putative SOS response-associated peptidase YedK
MCYWFLNVKGIEKEEAWFNARYEQMELFDAAPRGVLLNGFDHPVTSIILDKNPESIVPATWGLIPAWRAAQEPKEFFKTANTLNAKIETVESLATYKNYANNRCLVLAQSFKEWKHVTIGKKTEKLPYEIGMPDGNPFAMAGIYSEINNVPTFSILTTEANTLMAEIHNSKKRMPVILSREEQRLWLDKLEPLEPYHARTEIELKAVPLYDLGQPDLFA